MRLPFRQPGNTGKITREFKKSTCFCNKLCMLNKKQSSTFSSLNEVSSRPEQFSQAFCFIHSLTTGYIHWFSARDLHAPEGQNGLKNRIYFLIPESVLKHPATQANGTNFFVQRFYIFQTHKSPYLPASSYWKKCAIQPFLKHGIVSAGLPQTQRSQTGTDFLKYCIVSADDKITVKTFIDAWKFPPLSVPEKTLNLRHCFLPQKFFKQSCFYTDHSKIFCCKKAFSCYSKSYVVLILRGTDVETMFL